MKKSQRAALFVIIAALFIVLLPNSAALAAEGDGIELAIDWARTPENASSVMNDLRGVRYLSWSSISQIKSNSISNVWDAQGPKHNFTGYLADSEQKQNAATWANFNSDGEYSIRRFTGTFALPDGYSSKDYFSLKSVNDYSSLNLGDIIAVNDNMYVFLYPKGTEVNNSNYMNYLAFWTGTDNQVSVTSFNGVLGTKAMQMPNLPASHPLKHVDGWHCPAAADNIGQTMAFADPNGNAREWIVDIFAEDYCEGGGMDRMALKIVPNDAYLIINYHLGQVGSTPYQVYVDKYAKVGDVAALSPGSLAGQLDWNRPNGYLAGVQAEQPYEIAAGMNAVNVVFAQEQYGSYTVQYIDRQSGAELFPAKLAANAVAGVYTECPEDIEGFVCPSAMEQIQISQGEDKLLVFLYDPIDSDGDYLGGGAGSPDTGDPTRIALYAIALLASSHIARKTLLKSAGRQKAKAPK
ncbi:MAG: hypothetical protein FWG30_07855 [Eubacteriaceae bacterium]|nr:hypothetical protein [Eubacteriaceae bacterium]